jgi:hypothetical protein
MRRVDRELGPGVWEEPDDWRDEPERNDRLYRLLSWHDHRLHWELLETYPFATREWWLEHSLTLDQSLKLYYSMKRMTQLMSRESVLLQLIPRCA